MRWFCVHPALPDNATLRVRSYPSSDAPELGRRVPKGRAIAVVAPEFEVVAASEAEVHRWVRVVAPDGDTGEERDGFMMASLPDGTDLLTSWHKAGFRSCCRVENPKAFLFDGPTAAADVVGLVESIDLPYGILEVKGSRALIQHAEHEHVWIDTKELDPVCLPLHHSGCSVAHSFFTLNEALPPEAQIAIRTFPSKEADTVGLLSRGDILEVSFKSGPWLQIATADGGDAFWIMWTTETVKLLVEVSEHGSPRCMPLAGEAVSGEAAELKATEDVDTVVGHAQLAEDGGSVGAETLVDGRDRESTLNEELTEDFSQEDATEASKAVDPQLDQDPMIDEDSASGCDSLTTNARVSEIAAPEVADATDVETPTGDDHEQADLDNDMAAATASVVSKAEASWEDRPIKPARQQQFSWDDRPIRPPRADESLSVHTSTVDDDTDDAPSCTTMTTDAPPSVYSDERPIPSVQVHAAWDEQQSGTAAADMDVDMNEDADEISVSAPDNEAPGGGEQEAIAHPDERPIGPARHEHATDERPIRPAASASAQDGGVSSDGLTRVSVTVGVDPDDRPIQPSAIDVDTEMDTPNAMDSDADARESGEPREGEQQGSPHPDDRPIRPVQQQHAWDERPIQPARLVGDQDTSAASDTMVEDSDTIDPVEQQVSPHPDDRPIRPAQQQQAWDERPIQPAQPVGDLDAGVTCSEMVEDVTIAPVERPIRPAPSDEDTQMGSANSTEIDNDVFARDPAENENDQATFHPDERPIKPAQHNYAWDERPIRPAITDDSFEGAGALAHASDTAVDLDEQLRVYQDERPIRPAQQHTAWNEEQIQPALSDGMETDVFMVEQPDENISSEAVQDTAERSSPHWDERPVQPAQQPFAWDERPVRQARPDETMDEIGAQPDAFDAHSPSGAAEDDSKQDGQQTDPAHSVANMEIADDDDAAEEMETKDVAAAAEVFGDAHHDGSEEVKAHWDDRPIRPAQTQPAWDDRPIKPAQQDHVWDAMPIRPTSEVFEMEVQSADEADASGVASHEVVQEDGEQVTSAHWDDRPIKPAQQPQAYDDRPIRPASSPGAFAEEQVDVGSDDLELEVEDATSTKVDTNMGDAAGDSFALDGEHVIRTGASREAGDGDELRSEDVDGESMNALVESATMPRNSCNSDSEPTPELEADGYSFLTQFGVAAYYNWKKRSMTSRDELSQIQYDAMVEGDVDVLLETLAADVEFIDDWLQYVPVDPASVADVHGDPSHVIDVLYDRDLVPSDQPRPAQNGHAAKPPMLPLSPAAARKARLKALFRRPPASSDSTSVFDVIMGGGSGDSIIEAEVADDDSDFALTSQFRYPTKARRGRGGTPGRPSARRERSPIPIVGGGTGLRRAVSAGSVAPPSTNGNDVGTPAPTSTANDPDPSLSVDRVLSTPAAKANPLKRPAASIAKTPPSINPRREAQESAAAPTPPPAEARSTRQDTQKEVVTASASAAAAIPAPRSSIAPPSTTVSSGIAKSPGSSLPASSLARPRPAPLTSRLSAPSSISSIAQRAGSLPQPSAVSRSALPTRSLSTTAGSGIPSSAAGGGQSLLPRRSMLPTPTKLSGLQAPAARSIAQATSTSTLEARRATFGFARPRPSTISKSTK